MKEVLNFRKAQKSDADLIQKLVNSAYRGDSSREGWTTEADILDGQRTDREAIEDIIQSDTSIILLAEIENELLASVQLERKDEHTCYFGMFTVKPKLQGKGIGKKLMAKAEQFARETWNCDVMEMTVITVRHELLDWYIKHGYQKTEELVDFPYGDERFGVPLRPDLKMRVLRKSL